MVSGTLPVTPDAEALMVVAPATLPVATPPWVMVATAVSPLCQVTSLLIGVALPSENRPVALYCCSSPAALVALGGSTWIPTSTASVTSTGMLSAMPW